jgi:cytochrome c-type biogenesis protein CcmH
MRRAVAGFFAAATLAAALLLTAAPAFAVQPDEILKDPALEQRARALSAQMRCLVCQNQSIDDSDAPLAKDLRIVIRERLTAGDSDDQVKAYLVDRYGQYVLLKPPFGPETWALWLTPFLLVGLGAAYVLTRPRRAPADSAERELDDAERRRIAALSGAGTGPAERDYK